MVQTWERREISRISLTEYLAHSLIPSTEEGVT